MLGRMKDDWQASGGLTDPYSGRVSAAWEVMLCVTALLAIGSVMVYSATTMFADNSRYDVDAGYFIVKHLQSLSLIHI